MTSLGSKDLLKFLQWLLKLLVNSLRRPLLLLVYLFRHVGGVRPPNSPIFRSSKAGRSMESSPIAPSHVPSISVTRNPGLSGTPTPGSPSSRTTAQAPALPASALHPNHGTRTNCSDPAGSGFSSDSSGVGLSASDGGPTITPPSVPMPTPTFPVDDVHRPSLNRYPPSITALSMATGLLQGHGRTPERGRDPVPFGASQVNRYDKEILMKVSHQAPEISAFQRDFEDPRDPSIRTPWRSCVHPEGSLYFYHTELHIFTDCDIRRSRNCKPIESCYQRLFSLATQNGIALLSDDIDIVLELKPGKDKASKRKQCMYYIVDKSKRTLFWLHKFNPTEMYGNVKGVKEPTHIKCALEMQYWIRSTPRAKVNGNHDRMHCELYPYDRVFDRDDFYELRGIIVHANAEKITSDTSLAPFETDELSKMMDIMNVLEGTIGQKNDHLMCVVARFMRMFSRVHFFNFHGQLGARLDVDQSIYETPQGRSRTSVVLRTVNWILFGAPAVHSQGLRRLWVDQTVNQPRWKAFVVNVSNEWAGFTIYSTVMLAVDVGFLAVPGVQPADPISDPQPVCVVATYISVLCTIGSLVASIILSSQSRRTGYGSAVEIVDYMVEMTSTLVGIDHLAIMYSVPYGLLLWGMVFFFVALADVIFRSTYRKTLILIGVGCLVIMVFVFWPLWGGKERYFSNPELLVERVRGVFNYRGWVGGSGSGQLGGGGGGTSSERDGSGKRRKRTRTGSVSSAETRGDLSSDSENGRVGSGPSSIV
ncbi:hypothetical protein BS17DRAFT_580315 [Gyrodon lividus]|nr:hypothetical protein BS17DRAFT_580315 [Gyrodon lividus]